jgi:hypothetical protein
MKSLCPASKVLSKNADPFRSKSVEKTAFQTNHAVQTGKSITKLICSLIVLAPGY